MANETKIVITAATAQAEAALGRLGSVVGGVARSFAPFTAALSVAAMATYVKSAIDAANTLDDLSQATGTSVEMLAGLDYAARQNGASLETVARGGQKLASVLSDKPEIFRRLGIDAADSTEAMIQLSDVFANMPDGIEKSALATKLFGDRLGGEMILFLNQGTEAMRKNIEIGKEYNPVTSESAAAAAKFNDNLDALKMSAGTFGITLANDLLPALSNITSAMKDAYREGGLMKALWVGLGGVGTALFTDDMLEREEQVIKRLKEINELQTSGRALPGALRRADAEKPALEAELKQIRADREKLKAAEESLRKDEEKLASKSSKKGSSLLSGLSGKNKETGDGMQVLIALERDYQAELEKRAEALNAPLLSASEKALAEDLRTVHKRAQDARLELEKQKASQGIGAAEYSARLDEVTAKEYEQVKAIEALRAAQDDLNQSFSYGAKTALRQYLDEVENTAKQSQELMSASFKGMEDAIAKFYRTGSFNLESLKNVILDMLAQIAAKKTMLGLLNLFGSGGGYGDTAGVAAGVPSFDGGGFTGSGSRSGGVDGKGGFMAIMHPSETVIDHTKGQLMGGVNITYAPSISIDARSDSAQVEQLVSRAVSQGNAELVDRLQRQGAI